MSVIVEAGNSLEAWQLACEHILRNGATHNLILEVTHPSFCDATWFRTYNPQRLGAGKSLRDVADTIWPTKLAAKFRDRSDFYARYDAVYRRGKRRPKNRSSWGTYCRRLISFGESRRNQLEEAITKIVAWPRRAETAIYFHLSSIETDSFRTRAAPCLQYVELLWNANQSLDMVAIYRNHDYFHLALGNLIGLGDLLNFICEQTRKSPGRLVCHSINAFNGTTDVTLRRLVAA